MSKQITAAELGLIVNVLLTKPTIFGELDSEGKHLDFMTEIAKVVCDHCGGEVWNSASRVGDEPALIGIHGNDSLPDDGGVWKSFDPEGELYDIDPDAPDKAPCFQEGHWYTRLSDGALFIVPDDREGYAETYGPDDDTLEALDAAYRQADQNAPDWFDKIDRNDIAKRLNLIRVQDFQKRFDTETGWYKA
ncbi:hypothetical protein [Eoetvoesiella caeni]